MNFNTELRYPLTWKIEAKYHRCTINKKCQGYNKYTLIPAKYYTNPINLKDICQTCLDTFTPDELKDLKHYLIIRKLMK